MAPTLVITQYGQLVQAAKIYHHPNKPHRVNGITRTITSVLYDFIIPLLTLHQAYKYSKIHLDFRQGYLKETTVIFV